MPKNDPLINIPKGSPSAGLCTDIQLEIVLSVAAPQVDDDSSRSIRKSFPAGPTTMPSQLHCEMLFAVPRNELYSRLSQLIATSQNVSAVVGFLTEEGVSLIGDALQHYPGSLAQLVVGATTLKACDGLDRLISFGVPRDRLRVHLGHSRPTATGSSFVKYHPMMHSKIYLFEHGTTSTAIVGSHNMTGFAIGGQNAEASVLINGPSGDSVFSDIRSHIDAVSQESQFYDPVMRLAYAWWYRQLFLGIQYKVLYGTGEEDVEFRPTVIAIAATTEAGLPQIGDVVYLEVPVQFQVLKALREPVHFYFLPGIPDSVTTELTQLSKCEIAYRGAVVGSNTEHVVREGRTDWIIRDLRRPVLERTSGVVVPHANPSDVQAFVEIKAPLRARYEYIFDPSLRWNPVYDDKKSSQVCVPDELGNRLRQMDLVTAEHIAWSRVIGLEVDRNTASDSRLLEEISPESGRFVLFSRSRKNLWKKTRRERGQLQIESVPVVIDSVSSESASSDLYEQLHGVPAEVWYAVSKWAKDSSKLESWQRRLAYSLGKLQSDGAPFSPKQATQGKRLLLEAVGEGFVHQKLPNSLLGQLRRLE